MYITCTHNKHLLINFIQYKLDEHVPSENKQKFAYCLFLTRNCGFEMRFSWVLLFAVVVLTVSAAVTPSSKNSKTKTIRPTVSGKKTTKPKSARGTEKVSF